MGKARGERVLLHSDVRDNTAEKSGDFFPNQKIYLYIKLKKKKKREKRRAVSPDPVNGSWIRSVSDRGPWSLESHLSAEQR